MRIGGVLMKKFIKNFVMFILICIISFTGLFVSGRIIHNNRINTLKKALMNTYYSEENLNEVMKKRLGDELTGVLEEDINLYIKAVIEQELAE